MSSKNSSMDLNIHVTPSLQNTQNFQKEINKLLTESGKSLRESLDQTLTNLLENRLNNLPTEDLAKQIRNTLSDAYIQSLERIPGVGKDAEQLYALLEQLAKASSLTIEELLTIITRIQLMNAHNKDEVVRLIDSMIDKNSLKTLSPLSDELSALLTIDTPEQRLERSIEILSKSMGVNSQLRNDGADQSNEDQSLDDSSSDTTDPEAEQLARAIEQILLKYAPDIVKQAEVTPPGTTGIASRHKQGEPQAPGILPPEKTDTDFLDKLDAKITETTKSWNNLEDNLVNNFGTKLTPTVTSLQNEIKALLDGSNAWGDSLNAIWSGFQNNMVDAFAKTVAEYVVTKAAMFAIDKVMAAKSLALSAASAAKSFAEWLPGAWAAATASYGSAAIVATAAILGGIAAFGSFESGGYTGHGRQGEPAGIVHRGEYVFDAQSTRRLGAANLEALRLERPGYISIAPPSYREPRAIPAPVVNVAAPNVPVNVGVYNNMQSTQDFLESREGKKVFLDLMREHQWRV